MSAGEKGFRGSQDSFCTVFLCISRNRLFLCKAFKSFIKFLLGNCHGWEYNMPGTVMGGNATTHVLLKRDTLFF